MLDLIQLADLQLEIAKAIEDAEKQGGNAVTNLTDVMEIVEAMAQLRVGYDFMKELIQDELGWDDSELDYYLESQAEKGIQEMDSGKVDFMDILNRHTGDGYLH